MKRLPACLRGDVLRQYRYGLYAVSGLMVVVWGVMLSLLPGAWRSDPGAVVPVFLVLNLIITTFYFMAAMVLLERSEGVLAAVVTSPLTASEYLLSKAASLAVLALLESLLIALLLFGPEGHWGLIVATTFFLGAVYALLGFTFVARYESINQFLMPSVVAATLLMLPLLSHFGLTGEAVFLWHPVQHALILLRAAYGPVEAWQVVIAGVGLAAWTFGSFRLARRQFFRFVVQTAAA